jgi:dihydroorotase
MLGHLAKGTVADICVFEVQEGAFGFLDVRGFKLEGTKRIQNLMTLRAGKVVWDLNGMSAADWKSELK